MITFVYVLGCLFVLSVLLCGYLVLSASKARLFQRTAEQESEILAKSRFSWVVKATCLSRQVRILRRKNAEHLRNIERVEAEVDRVAKALICSDLDLSPPLENDCADVVPSPRGNFMSETIHEAAFHRKMAEAYGVMDAWMEDAPKGEA